MAALLAFVALLPAAARDEVCRFRSPGGLLLAFGSLDPANPTSPTGIPANSADSGAQKVGDCVAGVSLAVTADPGSHFAGGRNRLKHQTLNAYLPYTVKVTPTAAGGPGNGNYLNLSVTGSIDAHDYIDLPAGHYTDSFYLVVAP